MIMILEHLFLRAAISFLSHPDVKKSPFLDVTFEGDVNRMKMTRANVYVR